MAQNLTQEETRKLERQRLAESMLYYPAEGDAHQVEARTAPAAPDGIDNLSEQIDALPNLGNEEKALAKAFGIAAVAGRNRGKIMNLAERPDPLAETTIAWWRLDFTANTWQNIVGYDLQPNVAAANQRRFASFKFENEIQKESMLKELLEYAYMRACQPVGPADGNAQAQADLNALRSAQRTSILNKLETLNPAKHMKHMSENLSRRIKNDLCRENNLATRNLDLVAAPIFGSKSYVEPESLRNISTSISNMPFGSMHNRKPLNHFLNIVAGVVNGTYNAKGAYQVLLHVLTGEPEELVRNHQSDGTDFVHAWSDLQAAFNNFGKTHDGLADKIRTLLRTRPVDVHSTICKLKNLIRNKNLKIDSEAERLIVTNYETTESIFGLLRLWFPSHYIPVKDKFERINNNAKVQGVKPRPAPILLAQLVQEYIRNEPALPQKTAEIHAISEVGDLYEVSQHELATEAKEHLAANRKASLDVQAMQFQRNFQSNAQGQPGQNRLQIPDHLRMKCLKCGDASHRMRDCRKYPNERIGTTPCMYCKALHTSECVTLKSLKVHELQAQAEAEDYEDSQAYSEACQEQASENL